jgi:hypothetical protein
MEINCQWRFIHSYRIYDKLSIRNTWMCEGDSPRKTYQTFQRSLISNSFVENCTPFDIKHLLLYEGVSKSFRTGRLERELQMVQLSATRCSCTAISWVSLVSFAAITLCVASQRVFIVVKRIFRYRLSPETFGYSLVWFRPNFEAVYCEYGRGGV